MKKSLGAIFGMTSGLLLLAGCATAPVQIQRPGIDAVKKVAVISVTSNLKIRDIEEKEPQKASGLAGLLGAVVQAIAPETAAEQVAIVTHADKKIGEMFAGLDGWTLLPEATVLGNADYKAFFGTGGEKSAKKDLVNAALLGVATPDTVVPAGMYPIPLTALIPGTNKYVNGEREEAPTLRKVGSLCAKLGVDAVAVAEVKLSYKKTFLSGVSGSGLFANARGNSKPVVEVNLAVVNAKGELVLQSTRGWATFEGEAVPMMLQGEADLKDKDGKCVAEYQATVGKAVTGLTAEVVKQLAAK